MLTNKTALITGASRGIGRAIALDMAKHGAHIALNYYGETEAKNEALALQNDIKNDFKTTCKIYPCDISDFTASKEMVAEVLKDFPSIDILVNNAGIASSNPILRVTEKDYDQVLDINLKGSFNMIKHLYPQFMKNRRGTIINISSICGVRGQQWQATYSASKGGLIALTKAVAKELAGRNITCNAIAPGYILTDMTAGLNTEERAEIIDNIPLGRPGTADDVAKLATFLASDNASYITGEVIKIDGGLCI